MFQIKLSKFYQIFISIIFIINQIDSQLQQDDELLYIDAGDYRTLQYPERNTKRSTTTDQSCNIPNYSNSAYKILNHRETIYQPGDYVTEYSVLEITCDEGYKLPPFAQNIVLCIKGKWNHQPQSCLRVCPSLMSTQSTTVQCKYNGSTSPDNCINPVEGTMAHLSCNSFYEMDAAVKRNPIRMCSYGTWVPNLPECYATCGLKDYRGKFQALTGEIATPGNQPWNVGLYTDTREFLCSGTIIDENIVITAAHCFSDRSGNVLPAEKFLFAAGKYYRAYDDDRDTFAQYATVQEIFVPPGYESIERFYNDDIAVAILKYSFKLNPFVLPACINLHEESGNLEHFINNNSTFINWGYTPEYRGSSEVLTERNISYVPSNKCSQEVTVNSSSYNTLKDKLCGSKNEPYRESSICHSNSGRGLVNNLNGRHHLIGILSTSLVSSEFGTKTCSSDQYGLYTFVLAHSNFIQKLVTAYGFRWKQSIVQPNEKVENSSTQSVKCERCDCKYSEEANIFHGTNKTGSSVSSVQPQPNLTQRPKRAVECEGENCKSSVQYPEVFQDNIKNTEQLKCINQTLRPSKEGIYMESSRITYFDFQLLQMFSGNEGDYVISPARIKLTLAMLMEGSKGDIAIEISKASKIPIDVNSIRGTLNDLRSNLKIEPEDTILKLANVFAVSDKYTVRQEYSKILQDHYSQQTTSADFSNSEKLASIINNQTNYLTNGLISHVMNTENIKEKDSLIINNALFFFAQWKIKFTETKSKISFTQTSTSERESLVDILEAQSQFKYRFLEELNAQAVELPYSDGEHAMLILLPKESYNIDDLQRKMQYINFNTIIDSLVTTEVFVSLPKFEIQTNTNLGPILEEMGIKELFSENSDLSGIFDQGQVKVNKILHAVRLIVNKRGIRYQTVIGAPAESVMAHSPFLFFIYNMFSKNILFEGRLNSPFSKNKIKFCKYWDEIDI